MASAKALRERTIRVWQTSCSPVTPKVGDARALASVIGEDELSPIDKKYLVFGKEFERRFVGQGNHANRNIIETLTIGWELLGLLPRAELDRIDTKVLDQYYKPTTAEASEE